jgi:predicted house-cleaning noncanonical NTP pyrophosphatase (MazG superfamily)
LILIPKPNLKTGQHRFKLDKLIRDKMPDLMRTHGAAVVDRIIENDEYLQRLQNKLFEEAQEVFESKNVDDIREELADLLR